MSDLQARARAGEERSVFLLLGRVFRKRHTLIFNKLLFLTIAHNRMWTAFPPFIPNRCEDARAYYNSPAFTPALRLQNCAWRHAKTPNRTENAAVRGWLRRPGWPNPGERLRVGNPGMWSTSCRVVCGDGAAGVTHGLSCTKTTTTKFLLYHRDCGWELNWKEIFS